jgi:hypothetical protein
MLWLSHVQGEIIDKVGQYRLAVRSDLVAHCKTILPYLVDYLPLYMWQTQHMTTLQDDIVLPCRLSSLYRLALWSDVVFVTCTRGDNRQGRTISSCIVVRCCVCHMTTLQDDIVLPCRLSPLVHVTNTTSDHTAGRYCSTLSIISPVHSLVRSSYTIQIFRIEKIAGVNSWKFYIRCSNVKLTIVV